MLRRGERKFLLCTGSIVPYSGLYEHPEDHIVGELAYVKDENHIQGVIALALYEIPVSAAHVPPVNPKILLNVFEGNKIRCRYRECFRMVIWLSGRPLLLALMNRLGYLDKFLELENRDNEIHEEKTYGEKNRSVPEVSDTAQVS